MGRPWRRLWRERGPGGPTPPASTPSWWPKRKPGGGPICWNGSTSSSISVTRPDFKGGGKSGDTRRERYGERYHAQFSSFDLEAAPELDEFLYDPFYQIMRQRLLADRMVRERELDVDESKVVVVAPERNLAYRSTVEGGKKTSPPLARRFPQLGTVEEVMRAALKDPGAQFSMIAPSASRATLAVNSGLCFVRPLDTSHSSLAATAAFSLGAGPSLSHLSSFLGPPHNSLKLRTCETRL